MSDYVKTTNFTAKDALATGDPNKLITGALFDTEFDALAIASATKEDASNKSAAGGYAGLDGAGKVNDGEMPTASQTIRGPLELATQVEVDAGTDDTRAVTSLKLAAAKSLLQATEAQKGAAELATQTETNTGTDDTRIITPLKLATATSLLQATAGQKGAVELATQVEADAGTDTARVITPVTLKAYAGGFSNDPGAGARGCLAFGTSVQGTVNNVLLTVTFDSEGYDTDSIHDAGVNPTRLTVPAGVTRIRLSGNVQFANNVNGYRHMMFTKNGSTVIGIDDSRDGFIAQAVCVPGGGTSGSVEAHGVYLATGAMTVAAGDFFELRVRQGSGSNIDLLDDGYWMEMEILE